MNKTISIIDEIKRNIINLVEQPKITDKIQKNNFKNIEKYFKK